MPTLDERVAYLEGRLEEQNKRFDGLRFDGLDAKFDRLDAKVDRLDAKSIASTPSSTASRNGWMRESMCSTEEPRDTSPGWSGSKSRR